MAIIINRVYTGVGDRGTTRLAGGQEVEKTCARIEAYGTVDELNAAVGLLAEHCGLEVTQADSDGKAAELLRRLRRIQHELFDLGGELATLAEDRHPAQALVQMADARRLEEEMDEVNAKLPTLRSFVLPGGGFVSAFSHHARPVCRRAERRVLSLHDGDPQREEVLCYLNRLSDWFFVMGRVSALRQGRAEFLWEPGNRAVTEVG